MLNITLQLDGSLRSFAAVPPERDASPVSSAPDWAQFFTLAHLDIQQFQTVEPEWTPLAATDARAAWSGMYPGPNTIPIRVEAASFRGKPVYFTIVWPWTKPIHVKDNAAATLGSIVRNSFEIIWWLVNIGAVWVARLNLKSGRGDARAAFRVGVCIGLVRLVMWVLEAHHLAGRAEDALFTEGLAKSVFEGVRFWIFYLALEPWVRRYWPQALITWARVVAGRVRDPLVGRDVLYAVLFGMLYSLFILAFEIWSMRESGYPSGDASIEVLLGMRAFSHQTSQNLFYGITNALEFFLLLFLLRVLVRKPWIAAVTLVAIFSALKAAPSSGTPIMWAFWIAIYGILVFLMLRFGMFALLLTIFAINSVVENYLTTDFTAWYGQSSFAVVVLLGAMAIWGFRVSLGGRPLFSTATLYSPVP